MARTLGTWRLLERLDPGRPGPTKVWRARNWDGDEVALKVIATTSPTSTRYSRFRDEVDALVTYGDHPGILPILDFHLPDDPRDEEPWLAMPFAIPIRSTLKENGDFSAVIEIISTVAETLADLAEEGVYHRDLKPDNLFIFDSRPVVADFGLVTFPGKTRVTAGDRRLGPANFHADEMLHNPDTADPGSADVYALLKTLYVLCTGADWPPQGQQRLDHRPFLLSVIFGAPALATLDLLIERGTSPIVNERPSMRDVAKELSAFLNPATQGDEVTDSSQLFDRIKEKLEADRRERTNLQERAAAINSIVDQFRPLTKEIKGIFLEAFYAANDENLTSLLQHASSQLGVDTSRDPKKLGPSGIVTTGASTYGEVVVHSGVAVWPGDGFSVTVVAAHVLQVASDDDPPGVLWSDSKSFMLGSSLEAKSVAELQQGLRENLSRVAQEADQALSNL